MDDGKADLTEDERSRVRQWVAEFNNERKESRYRWGKVLQQVGPMPVDSDAGYVYALEQLREYKKWASLRVSGGMAPTGELDYFDSFETWLGERRRG